MLLDCSCGVSVEGKLDVDKSKVFCMNCWKEVEVSDFTKTMMKSRNDIIDRKQITLPPHGFRVECGQKSCNKEFVAEVNKKSGKVFCPFCKTEAKLSQITIDMLVENKVFEGYTKAYFEKDDKAHKESAENLEDTTIPETQKLADAPKRGRGRPAGSKNKVAN